MKKILVTSLITSAIMIAIIMTTVVFMSKGKTENVSTDEQLDILAEAQTKDEIYKGGSEELTIAENGKILSFGEKSIDAVYNTKKSQAVMEKINKLKKYRKYTFDDPLFIWNPFGTNELSMYYYFRDEESTYIKYTIQVEDDAIPDFTRTLYNNTDEKTTRVHEYLITGFVPGYQNYLVLKRYNKKGEVLSQDYYDFYVEKLSDKVATKLDYHDGKSHGEVSAGLFTICGYNAGNENTPNVIPFYDNSGVIRTAIPIKNYRTDRMEYANGNMIYSYSNRKFAVVSRFGQVMQTFDLGTYRLCQDFIYNGYGQLWCIATDSSKSSTTVRDCIITVHMDTGKVEKLVDFKKIFPAILKKAKKTSSSANLNWIDLNSIQRVGSSDIIVSSRELSSIIKIRSVTSDNPKIGYIISEPSIWKETKYKKYLLLKGAYQGNKWYNLEDGTSGIEDGVEDFMTQFGQNGVTYVQSSNLGEGKYYLTMLNNNYGYAQTLPTIKWSNFIGVGTAKKAANNSYYYEYIVDENEGYYGLKHSYRVPYTAKGGNVFRVDNKSNTVANSMREKVFGEYDKDGLLIRQFSVKAYRVYKNDMKNFWFY